MTVEFDAKEGAAWCSTSMLKLVEKFALAVCGLDALTASVPVLVPTVAAEKE